MYKHILVLIGHSQPTHPLLQVHLNPGSVECPFSVDLALADEPPFADNDAATAAAAPDSSNTYIRSGWPPHWYRGMVWGHIVEMKRGSSVTCNSGEGHDLLWGVHEYITPLAHDCHLPAIFAP